MPLKKTITLSNQHGLHAGPAAVLARFASQYKSQIKVVTERREVDGKDTLQLMMLAAGEGTDVTLEVSGEDEQQAITELEHLIENGFLIEPSQ